MRLEKLHISLLIAYFGLLTKVLCIRMVLMLKKGWFSYLFNLMMDEISKFASDRAPCFNRNVNSLKCIYKDMKSGELVGINPRTHERSWVMIFVIEEELDEGCNCSWEVFSNLYWRSLVSLFFGYGNFKGRFGVLLMDCLQVIFESEILGMLLIPTLFCVYIYIL